MYVLVSVALPLLIKMTAVKMRECWVMHKGCEISVLMPCGFVR